MSHPSQGEQDAAVSHDRTCHAGSRMDFIAPECPRQGLRPQGFLRTARRSGEQRRGEWGVCGVKHESS